MILGQSGEDFAIDEQAFLFGSTNEFRVRQTKRSKGGVNLDVPKSAEVTLLVAAMFARIGKCFGDGHFGHALLGFASVAITLGR